LYSAMYRSASAVTRDRSADKSAAPVLAHSRKVNPPTAQRRAAAGMRSMQNIDLSLPDG
jgi:hypothetical protein